MNGRVDGHGTADRGAFLVLRDHEPLAREAKAGQAKKLVPSEAEDGDGAGTVSPTSTSLCTSFLASSASASLGRCSGSWSLTLGRHPE
jgi:hypothetical protein